MSVFYIYLDPPPSKISFNLAKINTNILGSESKYQMGWKIQIGKTRLMAHTITKLLQKSYTNILLMAQVYTHCTFI